MERERMRHGSVATWMGIFVCLAGGAVIGGWSLDVGVITSVRPGWVTMKFSTALSFFLSGLTLACAARAVRGARELAQVVLPVTTLIILLLMATLFASTLMGVRTGVEDLFVREADGAVQTTTPGRPSVGTMLCFIAVALAGIAAFLDPPYLGPVLITAGATVAVAGAVAMAGYALGAPALYYSFPAVSTAMAFHTAVLFVMLGAGFFITGRISARRAETKTK